MQPLELLQNIQVDNNIRAALDNNGENPIFPGVKGFIFSCVEFVVCLFLSLSPSWNTDLYIKTVYHFLFKQQLLDAIQERDERLLHEKDQESQRASPSEENEGLAASIPGPSDQEAFEPGLQDESMPRNRLAEEAEEAEANSDIQPDEKGDFAPREHSKLE